MTLAQFHPAPPPPDSPASLFSAWDYLPCCLYINPFLLSFTCYLEARNSSAAERLRPGQSFPGHQPYLLCSALLEASCAWGRGGKGVCWEGMSLCLYKVAAGRCVDVCVCERGAEKDKMKASGSVVSRGRGGAMSAQPAPPCPGGWRWSWLGCNGHGAGLDARVTGHATVWPTGPSGAIHRSGHHVH